VTAGSPAATFEERVLVIVGNTRAGEVLTYGEIAAEAGSPGAARAVGNVMARCGEGVPWWRVVTSTGRLVPGHEALQAARLRSEGVRVVRGAVPRGATVGSRGGSGP
jgi:methylated-DNA-protein-cysteine methyltransferase related protein